MFSGLRTHDDDLREAIRHLENHDHEKALPILGRVVAFDPLNALARELWVTCHILAGRLERALELVEEGLSRGIAPARLHVQKAHVLREMSRFDEAVDAAKGAVRAAPESPAAVEALVAAEIARGSGEAAIEVYREAVERLPDDEDVLFGLIALASEYERHDLVIGSAREYLRRFERDAEVLSMLGQAYVASGDLRRAERAFRDAAQLDPDEVGHHVNVVVVLMLTAKEHELEAYLDRLEARDPELAVAAVQQAEALVSEAIGEE